MIMKMRFKLFPFLIFLFINKGILAQNEKTKKGSFPKLTCVEFSAVMFENQHAELWAKDFVKSGNKNKAKNNFTFNNEHFVTEFINKEHYFKGNGLVATKAEYEKKQAQKWSPKYHSSCKNFSPDSLANSEIITITIWNKNAHSLNCVTILNHFDSLSEMEISKTDIGYGYLIDKKNVVFKFESNFPMDDIQQVNVAGTFNGWRPSDETWQMQKLKNNSFQLTISRDFFDQGNLYFFKYVINGKKWIDPPKDAKNSIHEEGFRFLYLYLDDF